MPKSKDLRMPYSHIRVTANKKYIKMIEERIADILAEKKNFDKTA